MTMKIFLDMVSLLPLFGITGNGGTFLLLRMLLCGRGSAFRSFVAWASDICQPRFWHEESRTLGVCYENRWVGPRGGVKLILMVQLFKQQE